MALALASLQGGVQVGTTQVTIYALPSSAGTSKALIKSAVFTNAINQNNSFQVVLARLNGPQLLIVPTVGLTANASGTTSSYVAQQLENLVLNPGDALAAVASVGLVNVFISGLLG